MPERTDLLVKSIEDRSDDVSYSGYQRITLDEKQRVALESWLDMHVTQIAQEMAPVLSRFRQEDNQLDGEMPGGDHPYPGAFRVNYPVTKRKVRELANRIKQAYLDAGTLWAVMGDTTELYDLAVKVEKALDWAADHELDEEDDLAKAVFSSTHHGIGVLVPCWNYQEGQVRDVETYEPFDGQTIESLRDILRFEQNYPNWKEEPAARKLHGKLTRGERIEPIEVSYRTAIKNQPDFRFIPAQNLRVYPTVEGLDGLRCTPVYGYVWEYTRYELEKMQQEGKLDDGALERMLGKSTEEEARDPGEQSETYEIFHGTAHYSLGEGKEEQTLSFWYAVKERVLIRLRGQVWWNTDPDMIPFYVRTDEAGFFKTGIAWDVKDEHVVLNVILNMFLNAMDMANSMRWKAKKGSIAERHILNRRWSPHIPVPWEFDPREVESMQTPTNHLGDIVTAFELMRRQSDEATGTTALQSGRESPTDPRAPATKTIALLQQVAPNEKDAIRSMEPGFRYMGKWALMMYYQGLRLGWIDEFPGGLEIPLEMLPMLANRLAPRSVIFDYDRQGQQERNMGAFQLLASTVGQTRPDIMLKALRRVLSQWDSQWSQFVDDLDLEGVNLPPQQIPQPEPGQQPGAGPEQPSAQPQQNGNGASRLSGLMQSV